MTTIESELKFLRTYPCLDALLLGGAAVGGSLDKDFGTRVLAGRRRPQSWCRRCRSRRTL